MRPNIPQVLAIFSGVIAALVSVGAVAVLVVNQPWVAPATASQTTEAYMNIVSSDGAVLVGARSDAAATVSLRGPIKNERRITELALPARVTVPLAPGGYRFVLSHLRRPIVLGEQVPLTLAIRAGDRAIQEIPLTAEVRLHSPIDDERRARLHAPSHAAIAAEPTSQLDPFGQATQGIAACPVVKPPLLTLGEMRAEAHVRVERGTRCAMDGSCESGGAYRRDPEINAEVIAAISANTHFRDASVWVTTSRGWVTLEGCVRSSAQRKALLGFVAKQPNVARVFDELKRLTK